MKITVFETLVVFSFACFMLVGGVIVIEGIKFVRHSICGGS